MLIVLKFSVLRQLVSDLQNSLDVVSRIPYRSISTLFPRHGEAAEEVAVGVAASAGRPDGLGCHPSHAFPVARFLQGFSSSTSFDGEF